MSRRLSLSLTLAALTVGSNGVKRVGGRSSVRRSNRGPRAYMWRNRTPYQWRKAKRKIARDSRRAQMKKGCYR